MEEHVLMPQQSPHALQNLLIRMVQVYVVRMHSGELWQHAAEPNWNQLLAMRTSYDMQNSSSLDLSLHMTTHVHAQTLSYNCFPLEERELTLIDAGRPAPPIATPTGASVWLVSGTGLPSSAVTK
jgi:hypothetical protein